VYVLEDQEKWPKNGTLDYNIILQLILFCRTEGKCDEVPYVDLFFTWQIDYKSRKDCGLITKDTNVLPLEKLRTNRLDVVVLHVVLVKDAKSTRNRWKRKMM